VSYRRGLAQLYTDLGDAHLRSAHGSGAGDHLNQAEHWYRRALELWDDVGRLNALWANERNKSAEVSRQLAECEHRAQRG
jgi:hypothetical protein